MPNAPYAKSNCYRGIVVAVGSCFCSAESFPVLRCCPRQSLPILPFCCQCRKTLRAHCPYKRFFRTGDRWEMGLVVLGGAGAAKVLWTERTANTRIRGRSGAPDT